MLMNKLGLVLVILSLVAGHPVAVAEDLSASLRKSYAFESKGQIAQAIEALSPMFHASGTDYLVNLRMAWLFRLQGSYLNSRSHYQNASRSEPGAVEPLLGLIQLHVLHKKWKDAETTANQLLGMYPDQLAAAYLLIQTLVAQDKCPNILTLVARLKKSFPIDRELLKSEEYCLKVAGKEAEAQAVRAKLLLIYPDGG